LNFFDGFLSRLDAVKNYESLALGPQIGLGDDIYDFAILGEEFSESFLQLVDFDAFFEVADINTRRYVSGSIYVSMCNDTYVALGGGLIDAIWSV
jgi:hypothetical protein